MQSRNRKTNLRYKPYRYFSTRPDSSISKTATIQQQFLVIPHKDLHPDLKLPALHIKCQNLARIGGCIVYPLLSIYGIPFVIFWTPGCVGIHHTSIRFAYRTALEIFKSGDIVIDPHLNQELKAKMAAKELSRLHINYQGNLVLHTDKSTAFSLAKFKGISLLEKTSENSLILKINTMKDQIFFNFRSQISYFHLEEDIQKQVEKILAARQLRLRSCMGVGLVASIFGTGLEFAMDIGSHLPLYISIGLLTQSSISNFRVAKHTNDLWNLIHQKNNITDIIKPKYRAFYLENDFNKDIYLNVSTFGNIQYSNQNFLSTRKKHLCQHVKTGKNKT